MTRLILVFVAVWGAAVPAFAQGTVLRSLQGAKSIPVQRGKKRKTVKTGAVLQAGDKIKTGKKVSATISYADGSELFVGRSSTVVVGEPKEGADVTDLDVGHVRAVVAKSPSGGGKHHFMIRTRAAVMGVRGTDFVVDTDAKGASTEVHTLDGQVEVAKDESSLAEGKGFLVNGGELIQAKLGSLKPPTKFDKDKYLNQLQKAQPDMHALSSKADEAKSKLEEQKKSLPAMPKAPAVTPPPVPQAPKMPQAPPAPSVPQPPKAPDNPFGH